MELIKTQMQVRADSNGPIGVIKKIYNTAGIRGLATGLGITIAREVPACGLYFSSYELMVRYDIFSYEKAKKWLSIIKLCASNNVVIFFT